MSKQALLGAILASSASLGLAVSGKCSGNDATATDLSERYATDPDKFQFGCTGGYQLKANPETIDFAGSDAAAKTATCCDEVSGKCGENKATATDLAELNSGTKQYQFACGAGYTLKGNPVVIPLAGADAAAKRATCCDAVSGQCSNNAVTATGLAEASTPAGTFQFACGDEFLKPNIDSNNPRAPGSGNAAAQKAACCEIPKCSSQGTNPGFCGTGKELDGTKSDTNCDAAACNSDASRTACCKTSGPTGAECSTIASTEGFCGGQKVYDSSKATSKCAGTPCSSLAGSDTTACCKDGPNGAECSTIASTEGFCGPQKVYNPGKATSKCADTPCNALTASDTAACCKDGVFGKCGGNTATATNLAEKKDEFYQFACGTGFALKPKVGALYVSARADTDTEAEMKETCCKVAFTCPAGESVSKKDDDLVENCCHSCKTTPTDCAEWMPMVIGNGCYAKCSSYWTTKKRDKEFKDYTCSDAQKKEYADKKKKKKNQAPAPAPAPAAPAPGPSGLGSDGSESSGITTTFSLATIAAAFIAIAALL